MSTVSFTRTEAWHSGWQGKQSATYARRDGMIIGIIRGREDAGISGWMHYEVSRYSRPLKADELIGSNVESIEQGYQRIAEADTMAEAKRLARERL